jgi:hypothetical protein
MKTTDRTVSRLALAAASAAWLLVTAAPAFSQDATTQSSTATQTTTTQTTTQDDNGKASQTTTQTTVTQVPATPFQAPDRPHLRSMLGDNQAMLRQYNWEATIDTTVNGQLQNTEVFTVAPGDEGHFVWTSVSRKEAGFANRKQQEDARSFRSRLQDLVASYEEQLRPGNLTRFIETADYSAGAGDEGDSIRVKGSDIVQPGDSMILWLTPDLRPKHMEVHTALDKDLVTIRTDFTVLESGPVTSLRTIAEVPSKNAVMTITNTKFEHLADHHQP